MHPELAALAGPPLLAVLAALCLRALAPPLRASLTELCGTPERAAFWTTACTVLLVACALVAALLRCWLVLAEGLDGAGTTLPASLLRPLAPLRAGLLGLLAGLAAVAWVHARFERAP